MKQAYYYIPIVKIRKTENWRGLSNLLMVTQVVFLAPEPVFAVAISLTGLLGGLKESMQQVTHLGTGLERGQGCVCFYGSH